MPTAMIYPLAALVEIAGFFAVWAWWRGASILWLLPGIASLALSGWLLAQVEAGFARRACGAYGGVHIAASLLWMWGAEGQRPDLWDAAGGCLCLIGAAMILLGPRAGYPRTIRVNNGSEFISRDLDFWAYANNVTLDFSRPGKPTNNGFIEAFNSKLRVESLNVHWFINLADAREKLEDWRRHYNED